MAKQVQLRRGTTLEHNTFTGADGEVTVDTTKDTLVVHNGATIGGIPLARQSSVDLKANLTEVALKAPIASPTFTGVVVLPVDTVIGEVSSTEISYLDGITSNIQHQINSVQAYVENADAELGIALL
jgi:hypothetical protein